MAEINLNSLPNKSLAAATGYVFGLDQSGANVTGWKMPAADVKAAAAKADTALQAADVAAMAYEDPADWVPRGEYDTAISDLTALTASLQTQVTQLLELVGAGSLAVFEPNVFETGVFA